MTEANTDNLKNLPINRQEMMKSMNLIQALLLQYETAMKVLLNKLDYLSKSYKLTHDRSLIDSTQSRIKQPESIAEKLHRKNKSLSVENIINEVHDIAGIRVIVPFLDDVQILADLITAQPDIKVLKTKDYITNPKPNGYQSLHLILEIPIYVSKDIKVTQVELQIRTIAMNFWASLEHELNYKKDVENKDDLRQVMTDKAKLITKLDYEMNDLKQQIWRERPEQSTPDQKY